MLRPAIFLSVLAVCDLCAGPVLADTVTALLSRAQAAEARGETDLALRMAQSAIVADPAHPAPYVALGDLYVKDHQPESARSYYNEALSIDPSDAGALKAIAALDRAAKNAGSLAGASAAAP